MKTLLFIVLKVLETITAFAIVGGVAYSVGYFRLVRWFGEHCLVLFLVLDIAVLAYCLYSLISDGSFKEWFALNKKWVNSIFDKINLKSKINR